jgi:2-polyprenyl-3-methyl-5-hydroxy-6-metoxy-1,4-benzoquinol methylase
MTEAQHRQTGFWSRLGGLVRGVGRAGAPPEFLKDAASFWGAVSSRRSDVVRALYARYPLVPRSYIDRYFLSFTRENPGNPRALLYLDAELGAPDRAVAYLKALESVGITYKGARCLDIGCSNGALLLAATAQGASRAVGAEISPLRAMSARELTQGSSVEILVHDIARGSLPEGYGPFDLIFCIDVLEHVSSATATLAAIKRHLDTGPRARAFVSVFNPRHPANVTAEPHYGVPAMVLLPHEDAESLWEEVRGALGSSLEYEVSDWVPYRTLIEDLRSIGFGSMPFVDSRPILERARPFWLGFRERCENLEARVSDDIRRLPARPELQRLLLEHLRQYCARYLQDHLTLSSPADISDETLLHFFMDYYSQPIQLVLWHGESQPCNTGP